MYVSKIPQAQSWGGGGAEEVFPSTLIVATNLKPVNIFKENIRNCIY